MDVKAEIRRAVERLRAGGLVAFPTETVYGLGADAMNAGAVASVFQAKGRPPANPLIVHVADAKMARRYVASWPETAGKLASEFWPGPVTLVLPRAEGLPDAVTGGGPTVAVRAPDHPIALALLKLFGGGIVGPSANPSGYLSPTTAEHVRGHFDEQTALVLDGGPCRAGIESTVLDLTGDDIRVLRRGAGDTEKIEAALGRPLTYPDADPDPGKPGPAASPGLLGPHYQPEAPVHLVTDVAKLGMTVSNAGGPVALLSPPGRPVRIQSPHLGIKMPGLASAYARRFYAALREADEFNPAAIVVVVPALTDSPIWEAVRDRLRRAAA